MIARYWSGRIRNEDAREYADYLRETGVAAHRKTAGNLGSMVLMRAGDADTEVVVLSLWQSLDAIRRFAGADPETAVFFPEDERFLVSADKRSKHYDVPVHAFAAQGLGAQ